MTPKIKFTMENIKMTYKYNVYNNYVSVTYNIDTV